MPTPNKKSSARMVLNTGPLAGANVVVTRPAATAQSLKRRIRGLGGNALSLPGIALHGAHDVAASKRALATASSVDVAIFVSPAAVRFAFALCPHLRFKPDTQVCAVGAATARALSRHGMARVVWPRSRQDSEGLLALDALQHLRGHRLALIGAAGGRGLLAQTLRARAANVDAIHVYRRDVPVPSTRQLLALESATAPLFTLLTSAEVLANLRTILPLRLFARLAAGELIVSSGRLQAAAQASLFTRIHVAASPAPADLLQTACGILARHRL